MTSMRWMLRMSPDYEGLRRIPLSCECNDVITALQLSKSVALGIPPKLDAPSTSLAIHHACTKHEPFPQ